MALGTGRPKMSVFACGERKFFTKATDASFTFDAPGRGGMGVGGVLHWGEQDVLARRTTRPVPSTAELKRLDGDFYSDELHVLYSVSGKDDKLVLTYRAARSRSVLTANANTPLASAQLNTSAAPSIAARGSRSVRNSTHQGRAGSVPCTHHTLTGQFHNHGTPRGTAMTTAGADTEASQA